MTRLPWKYCECGCHGSYLDVGPIYFSLNQLRVGVNRDALRLGAAGPFPDGESADAFVRNLLLGAKLEIERFLEATK